MDDSEKFRQMRDTAREIFRFALAEASIAKAFARHVHCERGVLRVLRRGQHPGRRPHRVPGLQGQQPGSDPRAGDQQDQHDGEVPAVDAFAGVPLARDSVSGDATTVYWL